MCEAALLVDVPKYDLKDIELLDIIKSPFKGFTSIGCLKCQKFANIPRCMVYICPNCSRFYLVLKSSFELEAYPDYGPDRERLIKLMLNNIDNELAPYIRLSQVAKLNAIPMDYAMQFAKGEINNYLRGYFNIKEIGNGITDLLIHRNDVRSFYERIRSYKITSNIRVNLK